MTATPDSVFQPSRHSREVKIADWQDAEELAAWHLRLIGFTDVDLTDPGADGGLDVVGENVAAQVKHWVQGAGAVEVQQLRGASYNKDHAVFYCLGGYTAAAVEFARSARVALFSYDVYGDVVVSNSVAEELISSATGGPAETSQDPSARVEDGLRRSVESGTALSAEELRAARTYVAGQLEELADELRELSGDYEHEARTYRPNAKHELVYLATYDPSSVDWEAPARVMSHWREVHDAHSRVSSAQNASMTRLNELVDIVDHGRDVKNRARRELTLFQAGLPSEGELDTLADEANKWTTNGLEAVSVVVGDDWPGGHWVALSAEGRQPVIVDGPYPSDDDASDAAHNWLEFLSSIATASTPVALEFIEPVGGELRAHVTPLPWVPTLSGAYWPQKI